MCGIFGAVFKEANQNIDVRRALESISYRGPDSSNYISQKEFVFGHNRLAVLDLSKSASQPMQSVSGGLIVVFNGEIYNHKALRAQLLSSGYEFQSHSDTEVILHGYDAWGDKVFEKLDGMFSIGIFDARSNELFLARDRSGKKPLFYAIRGKTLVFASEIKAILASGFLAPELEEKALSFFMAFGYVPAPQTNYKGIVQLEPASILKYSKDGAVRIWRYWRAPFGDAPQEPLVSSAQKEIRRLVESSVRNRLEADVSIGAFLSGGVDSSIIVAAMTRLLGHPVNTFSIVFPKNAAYDEGGYARLVAKKFASEHTEYEVTPASFDLIEKLVDLYDGPFGDYSALPTYLVSKLARERVTVALTGDGGDELFCGYPRFVAGEWAEKIPQMARILLGSTNSIPMSGTLNRFCRMSRFLRVSMLPLPERMTAWSTFIGSKETLEWSKSLFPMAEDKGVLSRILAHNFETYLPYDLLVKADRASMAHGLELRSPFLDTALIEYAARLPASMLRVGRDTKWILKQAFSDLLPPEIMNRSKMGFGMPLGTWFRNEWAGNIHDYLDSSNAKLYGYVDPIFVRRLLNDHMKGTHDYSGPLWLLMTVEIWLKTLRPNCR